MRMSLPFVRLQDLLVLTNRFDTVRIIEEDGVSFEVRHEEREALPEYAVVGIVVNEGVLTYVVKPC